jgi:hypothetical protein
MADDDRDPQVAQWLQVDPLDDVTRRRLVSNALRESAGDSAGSASPAAPTRSSHAWQWLTAAAVIVVVLVVGLALLTAGGGNDEEQATKSDRAALSPKAAAAVRDVGNFGDLDVPANLARLRSALEAPTADFGAATPQTAARGANDSQLGASSEAAPDDGGSELQLCGVTAPDGGRVVAQGSGTIDGRRATVVVLEAADGTRTLEAVLEGPCEVRQLP